METKTLEIRRREQTGTTYARKLRQAGRVPGIIYSHEDAATVPFSVGYHDLEVELLRGRRVLSLSLEGQTQSYLIKELQYNHLGNEYEHIDLASVKMDEKVTLKVAIELKGTPKAAAEGRVLEQVLNEVEIECLASDIPNVIRVTVTNLEESESLTVGDLDLPDGVKAMQDATDVVATFRTVAEEAEPTETAEEAPAAPEVITKGKADEEDAEAAPK